MPNFTKLTLHFLHARTWKPYALGVKMLTGVFLFCALLFSGTLFAQFQCPDPKRCTSNDLEVVGASLSGVGPCFTCTDGASITTTITLTILNKTGSERTSFALFGTFRHGTTDDPIFICGGPIAPNATKQLVSAPVTFICGQRLSLVNNFLAWTSASDAHNSCDDLRAGNCRTIPPKCGVAAEIVIASPLVGTVSNPVIPCAGTCTGAFTVTATGGTAPYTYRLGVTDVGPTTASATFTSQCAGAKTVRVTDAAGCTKDVNYTLADKACCVAPPKPVVCQTPASLCGGDGKASLTISNAVTGDTYFLVQDAGGATSSATATSSTLTFTGLTPGKNFSVFGRNVVNGTTCNGPSATCTDLTGVCGAGSITSKAPTSTEITESETTVKAYPNPFSDRVKFVVTSPVAGRGNLEVYNMMGQKVKTVYQGFIAAGTQTFELSMPKQQISNLIYVLRIGAKKMSGKILQINQ